MSIRIRDLKLELERAHRAFRQFPTPSLAASIKQIVGALKYELRLQKKRERV